MLKNAAPVAKKATRRGGKKKAAATDVAVAEDATPATAE